MDDVFKVVRTLDYRGLLCPLPVIKISKAIKEVAVGDVVEMLADDPGAPPDIQAWSRQTGQELLSSNPDGKAFRFLIRRSK